VDQNINVLTKMVFNLLKAPRMHEIVGVYETQKIDLAVKSGGGRVPIGGGTGPFGCVLKHDGKRRGREGGL
jgi:hypothetical protein